MINFLERFKSPVGTLAIQISALAVLALAGSGLYNLINGDQSDKQSNTTSVTGVTKNTKVEGLQDVQLIPWRHYVCGENENYGDLSTIDGNIYINTKEGYSVPVTFSGCDSYPKFSSDKKKIVFTRYIGSEEIEYGNEYPILNNSVWILTLQNMQEEELVNSSEFTESGPKTINIEDTFYSIHGLSYPFLSADNNKVYFFSIAWTTSNALMSFDLKTKTTRFITDAWEARIIENGPYKGKIVVQKHKYYKDGDGGSYDHYFVVDDNGKEIKELGEISPY